MSPKWVLLVLEDGMVPEESLCHTIGLARRLGCSVSVLMLMEENVYGTPAGYEQGCKDLKQALDRIRSEGLDVRYSLEHGEKASGLLKHIALIPSLSALVWGGKEDIASTRKKRKGDHWFERVRPAVPCPIVSPRVRKTWPQGLGR